MLNSDVCPPPHAPFCRHVVFIFISPQVLDLLRQFLSPCSAEDAPPGSKRAPAADPMYAHAHAVPLHTLRHSSLPFPCRRQQLFVLERCGAGGKSSTALRIHPKQESKFVSTVLVPDSTLVRELAKRDEWTQVSRVRVFMCRHYLPSAHSVLPFAQALFTHLLSSVVAASCSCRSKRWA